VTTGPKSSRKRRLGRDGLGEVWTEMRGRTPVIVRRLALASEAAKAAAADITTAGAVRGEGLLPLLDVGVKDGVVQLAYEASEGRTLRELFAVLAAGREKFPVSHAAWIVMRVLEMLKACHGFKDEQGVINPIAHGRVSPEHIVVTPTGEVRLTGFGLNAAARHLLAGRQKVDRAFWYIAPEQISEGVTVPASDVFAIGTILVEALLGVPLFLKSTTAETARAIANDPVPPIRAARPEVPMALEQLLIFALNKAVDGRCPRADVMLDRMTSFLGLLEVADRVKPGEHPRRLADLIRLRLGGPAPIAAGVEIALGSESAQDESPPVPVSAGEKGVSPIRWPKPRRRLLKAGVAVLLGAAVVFVAGWVKPIRTRIAPWLPAPVLGALHSARDRVTGALPDSWRNRLGLEAAPGPAATPAPPPVVPTPSPEPPKAQEPPPRAVVEAPAPLPGIISVEAVPAAIVTIDGKRVGRTPIEEIPVAPGEHTIELMSQRPRLRATQKVTIAAGEKKSLRVRLR
jgi:eukaryotic-like serine/threonine-protein kinase